jgi:hypothetical protein
MSSRGCRLPVSGWEVALRAADGNDDVLLQEASGPPVVVALALLSRLAQRADGAPLDCAALTTTDFEFLLLQLHVSAFGPVVNCDLGCNQACGARLEIPFRVQDYLDEVRPRRPSAVAQDERRAEWFRVDGAAFRLPTVGDQAAVLGFPDAIERLVQRCVEPHDAPVAVRRRIERAMASLAPRVSRDLQGTCPQCGDAVQRLFYVPGFVVSELTRATSNLHDEVHWIASVYRWSEASILALPRRRRRQYADRARHASSEVS